MNRVGRYRWVEFLYYCCYVLHVLGYTSMPCGALRAFIYPIDILSGLLLESLLVFVQDGAEVEQDEVGSVMLA